MYFIIYSIDYTRLEIKSIQRKLPESILLIEFLIKEIIEIVLVKITILPLGWNNWKLAQVTVEKRLRKLLLFLQK